VGAYQVARGRDLLVGDRLSDGAAQPLGAASGAIVSAGAAARERGHEVGRQAVGA